MFKDYLILKKKFDTELFNYIDERLKTFSSDPYLYNIYLRIKILLKGGGKRLRPALFYFLYKGIEKEEKSLYRQDIFKISIALELIHLALLVQDDIMDEGESRHSVPTIHYYYQKQLDHFLSNKHQSYGESIAIIAANLLFNDVFNLILSLNIADQNKLKIIELLQETLFKVNQGQLYDLEYAVETKLEKISINDILQEYYYKTAYYTFINPIKIALQWAKNKEKIEKYLIRWATYLGLAFQIQDDILGIWGRQSYIGKSNISDIKEGKKTLLLKKCYLISSLEDKKFINEIINKKNPTIKEIEKLKHLFKKSGALGLIEKLLKNYTIKAKSQLINLKNDFDKKTFDFLQWLTEYIVKRKL